MSGHRLTTSIYFGGRPLTMVVKGFLLTNVSEVFERDGMNLVSMDSFCTVNGLLIWPTVGYQKEMPSINCAVKIFMQRWNCGPKVGQIRWSYIGSTWVLYPVLSGQLLCTQWNNCRKRFLKCPEVFLAKKKHLSQWQNWLLQIRDYWSFFYIAPRREHLLAIFQPTVGQIKKSS